MAEVAPRRKLAISKMLQQGGFSRPKTLTDIAEGLSLKAKFLRRLPSLKPDQRDADERFFGTRNGVLSVAVGRRTNAYSCIIAQKKTLARVKSEVSKVDQRIADARKERIFAGGNRRTNTTESIFLTSLTAPLRRNQAQSFSFLPENDSSVSMLQSNASVLHVRLSSPEQKIREISVHCETISKAVSDSKTGLERDMRAIKEKYGFFARHLSVLEIEQRRQKYFLLRKTFQMDTKKHMQALLGTSGINLPQEIENA